MIITNYLRISMKKHVITDCNIAFPIVPAYSTLVFDVTLVAIYHPGDRIPKWKLKRYKCIEQ